MNLLNTPRLYSYYGSGSLEKTNFVNLGRHMLLPEVSAIIGIYQLSRVEEFIDTRNRIAKAYNETFNITPNLSVINVSAGKPV